MTAHAESPSSQRTRDRIDLAPLTVDTIKLLHATADRIGSTAPEVAARIIEEHAGDPVRRVVAVVYWNERTWRWTWSGRPCAGLFLDVCADVFREFPGARIEDAGPRRYEVVLP